MKRITGALLLIAIGAVSLLSGGVWAEEKPVTPEQQANIEKAIPQKAYVEPAAPRKLLVFKLCKGYVHSSIPCGALAIEKMGQATGAYETTISEDPAVFAPDRLSQFDAVLMLNTTGDLFEDAALKQSFADFVKGGKGLAGVHAATDTFYGWPEYGEMIGGYFDGHPWGAGDTVGVKLDDPVHPVCEAFLGQGFEIKDEIYQFKEPYSRDKVRVLLSLDPVKSDMTKNGIKRTDGDFPISWVKSYGDGRVFYCSLGHNESTYWNPAVLKHYLAGLQFALGDLPADTIPSSQIDTQQLAAAIAEFQVHLPEKLVGRLAGVDYGQDPVLFTKIADMVNTSTPDSAAPLADALANVVQGEATAAAKQFACEQLSLIGTDKHVPVLVQLLSNPDTFEFGRYALQRIPSPAANDALIAALAAATGSQKVGLVNSLGERRNAASVAALTPLLADADPAVAGATATALAKLDSPDALAALVQAKGAAPVAVQREISEALLVSADRVAAQGNPQVAAKMYAQLYAPSEPVGVRQAAFKGLVKTLGEKAAPLLIEVLMSDDAAIQTVALEAAREVPGAAATEQLAANLGDLSPSVQAALIAALGGRGDKAAGTAVMQAATTSEDAAVRTAALEALKSLGNADAVPLLASAAAGTAEDEAKAARESLNRLAGPDIDAKLLEGLQSNAPAATKAEVIRAMAERRSAGAVPALMAAAKEGEDAVRIPAFKALADLAGPETMAELVAIRVNAPEGDAAAEAERAIVAVSKRMPDPAAKTADVLAALAASQADPAKSASLLRLLGRIGDDSGLDAVRAAAASADPQVREAAVRTLADWPTPAPMADLKAYVQQAPPEDALRTLALRGYLAQLSMPSDRPASDTLKCYEEGLQFSKTPEETKLAIAGLANVRDARVMEVLQPFINDPAYAAEAQAAADGLKNVGVTATASINPDDAKNAIDGNPETRWATGQSQQPGQWFTLDLGWERPVGKVTLDAASSGGDYPRGYEVYLSTDGNNWAGPVATGKPAEGQALVEITFEAKPARFVKIVQTGKVDNLWWSIHEAKAE